MIAMADAGGGQQYYGQTAEDLYDSFDQELSLLQAMYLRGIALKLIPAPGVIVEMLSVAPQHPDGTYKMNDLAWGAETWVGVRLHISPTAPGTLRDLLAVSITGTDLQGHALSQSGAMLQLPAVEQTAFQALLTDDLVERRLLEAEFGKASDELRHLARRGNRLDTMRKLAEMDERFGQHPWLKAKMEQMRRLAEEDMMMMVKEASFSAMRMSKSLASKSEVMFCMDETESNMPSFLRKKETEGRGRRTTKQN
jgi:Ca-activated chloride channel homolog